MACKTQLRNPHHQATWISPPACALVSPAVKESVSGEMEHSRHGGLRYSTLSLWRSVTCSLSVCNQPCFASTGPLKSQVTRWWWLSCAPVCQAGVCIFCSQELGGNPMTLNLETAATRDELENIAQVVPPPPPTYPHLGHPCLSLWLTLCPEDLPWPLLLC